MMNTPAPTQTIAALIAEEVDRQILLLDGNPLTPTLEQDEFLALKMLLELGPSYALGRGWWRILSEASDEELEELLGHDNYQRRTPLSKHLAGQHDQRSHGVWSDGASYDPTADGWVSSTVIGSKDSIRHVAAVIDNLRQTAAVLDLDGDVVVDPRIEKSMAEGDYQTALTIAVDRFVYAQLLDLTDPDYEGEFSPYADASFEEAHAALTDMMVRRIIDAEVITRGDTTVIIGPHDNLDEYPEYGPITSEERTTILRTVSQLQDVAPTKNAVVMVNLDTEQVFLGATYVGQPDNNDTGDGSFGPSPTFLADPTQWERWYDASFQERGFEPLDGGIINQSQGVVGPLVDLSIAVAPLAVQPIGILDRQYDDGYGRVLIVNMPKIRTAKGFDRYPQETTDNLLRWTLAHEWAHYVRPRDERTTFDMSAWWMRRVRASKQSLPNYSASHYDELWADAFAASMLAPSSELARTLTMGIAEGALPIGTVMNPEFITIDGKVIPLTKRVGGRMKAISCVFSGGGPILYDSDDVMKHLTGQHDQESHGSWSDGSSVDALEIDGTMMAELAARVGSSVVDLDQRDAEGRYEYRIGDFLPDSTSEWLYNNASDSAYESLREYLLYGGDDPEEFLGRMIERYPDYGMKTFEEILADTDSSRDSEEVINEVVLQVFESPHGDVLIEEAVRDSMSEEDWDQALHRSVDRVDAKMSAQRVAADGMRSLPLEDVAEAVTLAYSRDEAATSWSPAVRQTHEYAIANANAIREMLNATGDEKVYVQRAVDGTFRVRVYTTSDYSTMSQAVRDESEQGWTMVATGAASDPEVREAAADAMRMTIARGLIDQWSKTSNKTKEAAIIQRAAELEFGLEGVADYERSRASVGTSDAVMGVARSFVRSQYDSTQKLLREFLPVGTTHIVLYRGGDSTRRYEGVDVDLQGRVIVDGDVRTVAPATLVNRPMASFSSNRAEAEAFAGRHSGKGMFAAKVPVSRILSTPFTGNGALIEAEFVVLGGRIHGAYAPTASTIDSYQIPYGETEFITIDGRPVPIGKHLAGKHDQASHGSWADGALMYEGAFEYDADADSRKFLRSALGKTMMDLSSDEDWNSARNRYVASQYRGEDVAVHVNRMLRKGRAEGSRWEPDVDKFDLMVAAGEAQEDFIVFRSAVLTQEQVDALSEGAEYTDRGFQSSDITQGTAMFYGFQRWAYGGSKRSGSRDAVPVLFRMRVRKGTRAVDVGYGEVVIQRDARIRVLSNPISMGPYIDRDGRVYTDYVIEGASESGLIDPPDFTVIDVEVSA